MGCFCIVCFRGAVQCKPGCHSVVTRTV